MCVYIYVLALPLTFPFFSWWGPAESLFISERVDFFYPDPQLDQIFKPT